MKNPSESNARRCPKIPSEHIDDIAIPSERVIVLSPSKSLKRMDADEPLIIKPCKFIQKRTGHFLRGSE